MDAALFSNTPMTAFMDMTVRRFFDVWKAICAVTERRSATRQEQMAAAKQGNKPKPRKAKKGKRKR